MVNMFQPSEHWQRSTRGKELQFFATDMEMQHWLLNSLPKEYEPYALVGIDVVKVGKIYRRVPFELSLPEFRLSLESSHRHQFWIWSKSLTPDVESCLSHGDDLDALLSVNGLVSVRHGAKVVQRRIHGTVVGRDVSRISIVDQIHNTVTHNTYEHRDYLKVFMSLFNEIRPLLCYSTIHHFLDGTTTEEADFQTMTKAAFEQATNGEIVFIHSPGRLISCK